MQDTQEINENFKGHNSNILKLRNIGKLVHVKSPTKLTKDDLVDQISTFAHKERTVIVGNLWDEKADVQVKGRRELNKMNRENRTLVSNLLMELKSQEVVFDTQDVLVYNENPDEFAPYEMIDTSEFSKTNLSAKIKEYEIVDEKLIPQNLKEINGFVDVIDGEYQIRYLGCEKTIKLSEAQVKLYKFSRYDTVTFTAFYSLSTGQNYLLDIVKINGCEQINEEDKVEFSSLRLQPPTTSLDFSKFSGYFINVLSKVAPVFEGTRMLINAKDADQKTKVMQELSQAFSMNGVETFPVFVNCLNEETAFLEKVNTNVVCTGFQDTPEQRMEKILLSIFRAQRYVEAGQKVAIMIDDFSVVFDTLEELITNENPNYITTIATKLFNLGGCYDNEGSLTFITFCDEKNLRLFERLKRSASLYVPFNDKLKVYPAIALNKVENKLESFYMDDEARMVAQDIKNVVESKDFATNERVIKAFANLKGANREEILKCIIGI